jgi:hypothetical protein
MNEVVIDLREFDTLSNDLYLTEVEFDKETGLWDYNRICGTLTVSQSELAEVLGETLRYEIEFNNNLSPKWVFEYKGLQIDNFTGFEIVDIVKIEDEKAYFKVV